MHYFYLTAISVLLVFATSCASIPSSVEDMDSAWALLCELETVERATVSYAGANGKSQKAARKCSKTVSKTINPEDQKDFRDEAYEIFGGICQSNILIEAHLVTNGNSIGHTTRSCSR